MYFKLFKLYLLANVFAIPLYVFFAIMAAFSTDSGEESIITDVLLLGPLVLTNISAMIYSLKKKDIVAPTLLKIFFMPLIIAAASVTLFLVVFLFLVGRGVLDYIS